MRARETALLTLIACRRQGAWSEAALRAKIAAGGLDQREAALASRLCYGVLQNRILMDFYLNAFLTGSWSRLQPVTEDILRLGAYQLTKMDKIPVSAAVNESVELAKKYANPAAARLVNAVLRAMARAPELPEPPTDGIRYSHPEPLVQLLRSAVPEQELPQLLAADNEIPRSCVQINPLRTTCEKELAELQALGAQVEPHPWLPDCFYLSGAGAIDRLDAFREGRIYVQDAAAHLAALAAGLEPGMQVLDCCAAPGGKSFAAAMQMQNCGTVYSCDIHSHKIKLIEAGAARLGLSVIQAGVRNAAEVFPDWRGAMDAVIADVPCSGLGVIRKKPDIRYKDLAPLARLPEVQLGILRAQAEHVRAGGVLVYSTCTILPRENEAVVRAFLQQRLDFSLEPVPTPRGLELPNGGYVTLYPHLHGTDGFFICRMRKQR